jgi:hypothetical protein
LDEILGLLGSLLKMMAPFNLVELNHPWPHDSALLTQKLHWMLSLEQVDIERRDIINNDIGGWLQTIL